MALFSYLVLMLIGVAFVTLAFYFFLRIKNNMQQGRLARQQVAEHASALRMSRMLSALGIDQGEYLHKLPLSEVNQSLNNCETCAVPDDCDDKLQQDDISAEQIDFCPNQGKISEFIEQKSKPA